MADAGIVFEDVGIGDALHRNRLACPLNQREYSWEEDHVSSLYHDLENAISSGQPSYFLGTIVLTRGNQITDGQQRLATTTILLAAIRDFFVAQHDAKMVESLESDFLFTFDRANRSTVPRLTLNVDDNEFFRKRILARPDDEERNVQPQRTSHRRIRLAAQLAEAHIQKILKAVSEKYHDDRLNQWIDYVQENARIILLRVPDELNTYLMFETLNDRGLRTSQSDLVKNHLFGKSESRMEEAQTKWSSMRAALETLTEDDITVTYLRQLLIVLDGPTREKEVMKKVEDRSRTPANAIELLDTMAESAMQYVSIQSPSHISWADYHESVRKSISALLHLRANQIRPLMLAVYRQFSNEETAKSFRLFVSWAVRILIVGSRSGTLEEAYANAANGVETGEFADTKSLVKFMENIIPNDDQFRTAFSAKTVSQHYLARYYLRSLELMVKEQAEPEFIPNESTVITLEHVIPKNPEENWPDIEPELAVALHKRIGNLVLLPATPNSDIGNARFEDKKETYRESGYMLTSEVAEEEKWGLDEVNERQFDLANLAVKTWPLTVPA